MKVTWSVLMVITLFCSLNAEKIDSIDSHIDQVTVYTQGATLHRSASMKLSAGVTSIVIKGLPLSIDESTINIFTSSGTILLSEKLNRQYVDYNQIRSRYEAEKRDLQDSIDYVNVMIEVLKGQEALLNSNRSLQNEDKGFTTDDLSKLNQYYGQEMLNVKKEIYKLNLKNRDLSKRISQLTDQMNQEGINESRGSAYLIMELEVQKPGVVHIEFDYFVNEAGWTPKYDLRMEGLAKDLKIVYKASVYQNTGENWDDIQLILSTAQPTLDYTLPELQPYYLNFNNYYSQNENRDQDAIMEEVVVMGRAAGAMVSKEKESVEQYAPPTSITKSQTSFDYKITQPYSIPSSGVEQTVMLKSESVPVKYQYVTMPKLTETAYLTAEIKEWESLNLLYGEANIFIENKYSGKTYIGENQYTEDYVLSLGKDDNVIVKRELSKGYSKSQFIGNNRVETKSWGLSIKNNKTEPIEVILLDQYPISQNSDIKVDLKRDADANINKETGQLKWTLNIASLDKWSDYIEYEVKYPKDRNLLID